MVLPGRQLTGDERAALAACLDVPTETAIALTFTVRICDAEPFTGWEFVDLAARTGGTPATARWDTGAVLATVAHLAGPRPSRPRPRPAPLRLRPAVRPRRTRPSRMTGPDGHRLTAATATRSSSRPSTIVTFSGWTHWSPLRRRHQRRGAPRRAHPAQTRQPPAGPKCRPGAGRFQPVAGPAVTAGARRSPLVLRGPPGRDKDRCRQQFASSRSPTEYQPCCRSHESRAA